MNRKTDRRAALKLLAAAPLGLTAGVALASDALAQTPNLAPRGFATPWSVAPMAGSWSTWVLASGRELRLAPPPDEQATQAEIAQLRDLAARRDVATLDRISYWNAGAPSYRWTERAVKYTQSKGVFAQRAQRMLALLNVASHDALIAGWDAKYAYWYPRPQMVDPSITTVVASPNHPSYPSAHGFWSGAASRMLGHLFPRDAAHFHGIADEVAESRIMAGIHYRTDVNVALTLGRQVADAAWARGSFDGR